MTRRFSLPPPRQEFFFYPIGTTDGVYVYLPLHQAARLRKSCFKLDYPDTAGTFRFSTDVRGLFHDEGIRDELRVHLQELLDRHRDLPLGRNIACRLCICTTDGEHIGWSSTAPIDSLAGIELRPGCIGKSSTALKVQPGQKVKAPRTKRITIAFILKRDRSRSKQFVMTIGTIYPGHDIGELHRRDLTHELDIAFFPMGHPGE